jgi:ankyrin repeat domain-containing protein 50
VSLSHKDLVGALIVQFVALSESELIYVARFEDPNPLTVDDRIAGTCIWSTYTAQYKNWRKDAKSTIFWITGDAGTGKTILCSYLKESLETKAPRRLRGSASKEQALVSYYFCVKDDQSRRDACSVLRGLLLRIFVQRTDILRKVKDRFGSAKSHFDQSFENLWKMFSFAASKARCQTLYIVIDALDECEERSRNKLLHRIAETLQEWNEPELILERRVKFIITSQPHLIPTWNAVSQSTNPHRLRIEDRPQDMVDDMIRVIDKRVNDLVLRRFCTTEEGDHLKSSLRHHAESSFLWVNIILDDIGKGIEYNRASLERILRDPPKDLKAAYSRYLPPVPEKDYALFRKLIDLMVSCSRPLTIAEVNIFVTISNQPTTCEVDKKKKTDMQGILERAFGSLVRTSGSQARFVHSTVKDFLFSLQEDTMHPLHQSHRADLQSAHLTIASACVRYLLLEDLRTDLFVVNEPSTERSPISPISSDAQSSLVQEAESLADLFTAADFNFLQDEDALREVVRPVVSSRFPAYEYAALNWTHHYSLCETIAEEQMHESVKFLSQKGSSQLSNWYNYVLSASRTVMPTLLEVNPVLVAAIFGHTRNLQDMLEREEPNPAAIRTNALFWATCKGQAASVKLLLAHGTPPDVPKDQETPLLVAAYGGFTEIFDMLLATKQVDINFRGNRGRTSLSVVARQGHEEIMERMLQHKGTQVDCVDQYGWTPLLEAAASGSLGCLNMLISADCCDPNHVDRSNRCAISYAAEEGRDDVVRALLKNGKVDAKVADESGRNALSYAAAKGHLPIVRLLVQAKLRISDCDKDGRNAISWAANSAAATLRRREGVSVLTYLIKKDKMAASAADVSGWTPLAWAMEQPGYLDAVKALVEIGGVNVNQRDDTLGRPVLSWAATEGYLDIVTYLLEVPGIDENLADKEGRTPLSYAAANGRLEVVRMLVARENVDPHLADSKGRTPLKWAMQCGHESVVQELKELGKSSLS